MTTRIDTRSIFLSHPAMLRSWWGWFLFVLVFVCSAPSARADEAGVFREIRVCVRPPNVPVNLKRWAYSSGSARVMTGSEEVFRQKSRGHTIYILDAGAPPSSAQLLPIPHNKLTCPATALPLPAAVLPPRSPTPPPPAGEPKKDAAPKPAGQAPAPSAKGEPPPPQPVPIARAPPPPPPQREEGVTARWPKSVLPAVRGPKKSAAEKLAEGLAIGGAIANQQLNEDLKRPDGKPYGIVGGTNPDGPNHPVVQAAAGVVLIVAGVVSVGDFKKKLTDALKKKTPLMLTGTAKEAEKLVEDLAKKKLSAFAADALNKNGAIGPYAVMKKFTDKLGGRWQAHHILEKSRFGKLIPGNPDLAPSVLLTEAEHKVITAKLAAETASVENAKQLWKAYQKAYVDHPDWLKAIQSYFVKGK